MDHSDRIRVPVPPVSGQKPTSQAPNNQFQLFESGNPTTSAPVGEIYGWINQVALVEQSLRNSATPTLVARMAMLIAQMQAQIDHPDVLSTITSGIGSPTLTARFQDRIWHDYDLTHSPGDSRSHAIFGESARPPMDQERSLSMGQENTRVATPPTQYPQMAQVSPTPPPQTQPHFTCELPT